MSDSDSAASWLPWTYLSVIPTVGLCLWCLVPRLLRCLEARYWGPGGVTLPRMPVRRHVPVSEPTSPSEALPDTTAVGSFSVVPHPPAPTPTSQTTQRRSI